MTSETIEGKLTVWLMDSPIQNKALQISSNLTADGERLLVLDFSGCLDPSRISRIQPAVAKNIHVLRIAAGDELQVNFWEHVREVQRQTQARKILLTGILDRLAESQILTRDTARALGRIKSALEELADAGLEIHIVCQTEGVSGKGISGPGTRTYLAASLCAAADEVHRLTLAPQQYVNGASAAIA